MAPPLAVAALACALGGVPLAAQIAPPAPAAAPASEAANAAVAAAPLTLAEAVRLALAASPDVQAARAALAGAQAGVTVAGQLPNPELALEYNRETPRAATTLTVPLETGGKRQRRVELAQASVAVASAELARAELAVRQEVRRAYAALLGGEREATLAEEQRALAGRVLDAAQQRLAVGEAPRLEREQAQLLADQAAIDAESSRAAADAARAALDALLGRPTDAPLMLAPAGGLLAALPDATQLTATALAGSAELRALEQQVAEQSARVALVRAEGVPDLGVTGGVTHDSPPEFDWGYRFGLALTLPLFHGQRAAVAVEESALAQRQAELAAGRRRVGREVARTRALAEAARTAARRYVEEVLPRTEEVERMAEDAYRSGESDLASLLAALRAARETRLKAAQAEIDLQTALADLEQAVGAPLP